MFAGLNTLCAQLEQEHGPPIRFERDEQANALSPAGEIIVTNAARELLRKALRHASAKTLSDTQHCRCRALAQKREFVCTPPPPHRDAELTGPETVRKSVRFP